MKRLTTFSTLFWVNQSRVKNNTVSVYVRITVNSRRVNISLQRKVLLSDWDSSKGYARGTKQESRLLNRYLDQVRSRIFEAYEQLVSEKKLITSQAIKASLIVESPKIKKNTYALELKKVKSFLNQNKIFYKYYKTNCTHLDHKYFVRGNQDVKLQLRSNAFEFDPEFSTSNDFLVAKIKASEKLQTYLENKIAPTRPILNQNSRLNSTKDDIKWTGTKVALIELIYALHTSRVINKGETGIKDIANLVSEIFNIDLGDYYRPIQKSEYVKQVELNF